MTDRLLEAPLDLAIEVPSKLRREDSLYAILKPERPFPAVLALLTLGSLAIHAGVIAMAIIARDDAVAAAPKEIPIEIVSEPKLAQAAKAEPSKAPPAKKEAAKREIAKAEPAKPAAPTNVASSKAAEQTKPKADKQEPAKQEPRKEEVVRKAPVEPPAAQQQDLDALQKELASLKAEQAALHAQSETNIASTSDGAGEGPLTGSRHALAMPGASDTGDEVVPFQDLVFSQLAKAKGIGEYHGAEGTTGVHFAIDETGRLVSADVSTSSGSAELDAEALAIVRRAAPFPVPPKNAQRTFFANVNFVPPKSK